MNDHCVCTCLSACMCVCAPQLFEKLSRENTQLQAQLQDTLRSVSVTRMELEKATQVNKCMEMLHISNPHIISRSNSFTSKCMCVIQRQERFSDCTALLELEKKV